jgi:hypothetical protein
MHERMHERRHNPADLCHADDLACFKAAVEDAVARSAAAGGAEVAVAFSRRFKFPNGRWCCVHTSGCLQGTRWHFVCKLLRAQEAKERAIRALLLAVSHELRTPAQSGLAASQLLAQRAAVLQDAEAAFLAEAVRASCGLLLGAWPCMRRASMRRRRKRTNFRL